MDNQPTRAPDRYNAIAMFLHWTMAVLILAMIPMGWWAGDALHDPATQFQAYKIIQLHKSVGLTILVLAVLRLIWRLMHRAPAMPPMPGWQALVAKGTHVLFYVVMIGAPLSGWAYVSSQYSPALDKPLAIATSWFGLFTVPHLPGMDGLDLAARRSAAEVSSNVHSKLAWVIIGLVGLHVAAALKHQFIDKDRLMARMIPFLKT